MSNGPIDGTNGDLNTANLDELRERSRGIINQCDAIIANQNALVEASRRLRAESEALHQAIRAFCVRPGV